ncbi:hypothetical protein KDX38_02615 [Pseudomonas sp. CDFA 602]|uniref:hypothetical protein n=1 Tax=Pseudomonas californiensis TaxID=2829823 RepID=UPI001E44A340|nr:hypothetical protein [Pseudomonas californiensis]MCD5992610.1 hypothetical protein [Pseudomonas californiensis]MCD5998112.1 hypothetical protein [Pseudomonas californiensis]
MLIKTDSFIADPCDDEYDDMALLCCHSEQGELFSLSRFPDENEVDITVRDDKTLTVSTLKVTFSAQRLLVELTPADGKQLDGHEQYEIQHSTPASSLQDIQETLQIILKDVGTYVSEIN